MKSVDESIIILPESFQEHVSDLRNWLESEADSSHPVRKEAYWLALSATLMRLTNFEADEAFRMYSAMDIANIVVVAKKSDSIIIFIRAALSRAIVDEEHKLANAIAERDLVPDLVAWWRAYDNLNLEQAENILKQKISDGEEYASSRLAIGRKFPELLHVSWVKETAKDHPVISHAIARVIAAKRPDLSLSLIDILKNHPDMLLCRDPDSLLSNLVLNSSISPQNTLTHFNGLYGEKTLIAAARWHYEHGEYAEATHLARSVRILSKYSDQAQFIIALSAIISNNYSNYDKAFELTREPSLKRQITLRAYEQGLIKLDPSDLVKQAESCEHNEPETFYRFIKLLLESKHIQQAKSICLDSGEKFNHSPTAKQIINTVIAG